MPKAEVGTPKDVAKKMKAKGLQKLKFWCQLCHKQCRDANGFKCHLTSETHLRQMKLFSDQAGGVLNQYSREFEKAYLDVLRIRHTTTEVNANNVYQEVIQDKQHVHMNATIWATLSDFVKYLGKTGKCHVRETDRGWYIQYIEQNVETLAQHEQYVRRQAAEAQAEQLEATRLAAQRVEAAHALDRANIAVSTVATPLERSNDNAEPIKVALLPSHHPFHKKRKEQRTAAPSTSALGNVFGTHDDDYDDNEEDSDEEDVPPEPAPLPVSLVDSTKPPPHPREASKKRPIATTHSHEEERDAKKKTKQSRRDELSSSSSSWLLPDILVRVIESNMSWLIHRKAVVDRVLGNDGRAAQITILDSGPEAHDGGQVVEVTMSQLETVVGKVGKHVVILKGPHRGSLAKTLELNPKKERAVLELLDDKTILKRVPYDDFSKAA